MIADHSMKGGFLLIHFDFDYICLDILTFALHVLINIQDIKEWTCQNSFIISMQPDSVSILIKSSSLDQGRATCLSQQQASR